MDGKGTNQLVKGALVLTLAGLLSKILSAGYRIPLQNLTGDIGFYIYQQVYPLLGIATVLALYGFPSAISTLTAKTKQQGGSLTFRFFYGPIFMALFAICSLVFVFLYMNAEALSVWMGNEKLVDTYKMAAFVFLSIPFTSLLRGVLQGVQHMRPTAYSQIGEQIARVSLIIMAAYYISVEGMNIYNIGYAAGIASLAGALCAIVILVYFFVKNRPQEAGTANLSWSYLIRTLILFGLIASLNHMILIIIQFADSFTLVPGLRDYGLAQVEAMKLKGIFDRGQPLIQIGAVFGSSFALALIPNLTNRKMKTFSAESYTSVQSAFKFSFYLSFAAMIGLILIYPEVNTLLFQNNQGIISLRILAFSVLLSSLAITGTTILQGIGYLKRTAGFILVAFFIKWVGNQILVPLFEIKGSALATVISLLFLCAAVLLELKRKLPALSLGKSIAWYPFILAAGSMFIYVSLIKIVMPDIFGLSRLVLLLWVMFIAVTGACLYMLVLIRFKAFSTKELVMMPFANVLIRLAKEE